MPVFMSFKNAVRFRDYLESTENKIYEIRETHEGHWKVVEYVPKSIAIDLSELGGIG